MTDAGLPAVSSGVDGAANGELSGTVPQLPASPRSRRHRQPQGFVGDGEMGEPESLVAIPNLTGMESDRLGKTGFQPAVGGLARRIEIGGCWRITCSATLEWNSLPAPR